MNIFLKKTKFLYFIVIPIFLFVSIGVVYALGIWSTGYRINTETKSVYVGSEETHYSVTNTSGNSYFIPTKTTAEWNDFVANLPSGVIVSTYTSPTNFTFFRVNNNHKNDYDVNDVDRAVNYNGQSCIWKVYFDDPNNGNINYDVIVDGSVIMTVNGSSDCSGGWCRDYVDKCSSSYDSQTKTAYVVESGKTDTSGAVSDSFTNSCVSLGSGNDGWDNDCDRIFDDYTCGTCYGCNTCTYEVCDTTCKTYYYRVYQGSIATYSGTDCNYANLISRNYVCTDLYIGKDAAWACWNSYGTTYSCVVTGPNSSKRKSISPGGIGPSRCYEYNDPVCNNVTQANCAECGNYTYSCNCVYK